MGVAEGDPFQDQGVVVPFAWCRSGQSHNSNVFDRWEKGLTRRREGAEGWDRVSQLPKAFCGSEGVLECSGLTELWIGRERVGGRKPKRCQVTAFQETRMRAEFLENDHLRGFA
jgi:hypothetical protein